MKTESFNINLNDSRTRNSLLMEMVSEMYVETMGMEKMKAKIEKWGGTMEEKNESPT